jgi:hypothetical protein
MKRILLLLFLLEARGAFGDETDTPQFHFFTVPSPANACFAVQSVRPWPGSGGIGLGDIVQYGRIQLFRSETGAELWHIDGVLCHAEEVFPADDLKHLAIVRCAFPSRLVESVPVVSFYAEGKLVKSYMLGELGFDFAKLDKSASHSSFARTERSTNAWSWQWPLGSKDAEIAEMALGTPPNPVWRGTVLELRALDGQRFRFDGVTGKLLDVTRTP